MSDQGQEGPDGGPVVDIQGVVVRLGTRTVLDGLSCTLGRGVTAVVGPNGAGKSTLLRTLAGTLRPQGGTMTALGGHPYADRAAHRCYVAQVGWMPQSGTLPPSFTVRRLLEHAAWLKAVERSATPAAVQHAMEVARVTQFEKRPLGRMSGGERQRAMLAACLVNDPSVLVLDEPSVGLDPGQRETFHAAVRSIGETACVVVSTHILEDVFGVAGRTLGMRDGRVVVDSPMGDESAVRAAVMALFRDDAA